MNILPSFSPYPSSSLPLTTTDTKGSARDNEQKKSKIMVADERREEPPKAGTMRGANPPRICRSPLDRSTLIDSMRPYPTATQPQFKLNHKSGGRGKCAAHGEGETSAQGGKPSAAICRQENLSEKRRARFGQLCCPRLARSAESSANHAKHIGRTQPRRARGGASALDNLGTICAQLPTGAGGSPLASRFRVA